MVTPRQLPPATVNSLALFRVGVGLWMVGLLISAGIAWFSTHNWLPVWICVAALVMGALGYLWARRAHLVDETGMSEVE